MNVPEQELRTLLICSIRYAISRQTYMPSLVQEIAHRYVSVFTPADRCQLADEIRDAPSLGDERIDEPGWREFADWLAPAPVAAAPETHQRRSEQREQSESGQ